MTGYTLRMTGYTFRMSRLYAQDDRVNVLDDMMLGMSRTLHQAKMPEMKIAMIATGAM